MTIHHFFVEAKKIHFPEVIIYGREHHHLARVLRLKTGERIRIFNEKGEIFSAVIKRVEPERTIIQLENQIESEQIEIPLTLAQAFLRPKIMDWLITKMAELRVAKIIPIITQRTVIKLENISAHKISRWKSLALEAAKQSQTSFVPEIYAPLKLKEFVLSCEEEKKYFLSEHGGELLKDILNRDLQDLAQTKPVSVVFCVGPEGGWTKEEEHLFLDHAFVPVSLGKRIYRAETATFMVASILTHFWNA